jgi:hypothetical protein
MYKIVGADQKEYGPVTEEQLRQWITEGRANGQTIARLDEGPWKPLGTFPEFASLLGTTTAPLSSSSLPPLSTPPQVPLGGALASGSPPTSGMAITGLICSILGLFCCGPLFSTLGLIFSAMALNQINQDPARYGGKAVAVAGIVLSVVGYAIFAIFIFTGMFRRAFRRFPKFF